MRRDSASLYIPSNKSNPRIHLTVPIMWSVTADLQDSAILTATARVPDCKSGFVPLKIVIPIRVSGSGSKSGRPPTEPSNAIPPLQTVHRSI